MVEVPVINYNCFVPIKLYGDS